MDREPNSAGRYRITRRPRCAVSPTRGVACELFPCDSLAPPRFFPHRFDCEFHRLTATVQRKGARACPFLRIFSTLALGSLGISIAFSRWQRAATAAAAEVGGVGVGVGGWVGLAGVGVVGVAGVGKVV